MGGTIPASARAIRGERQSSIPMKTQNVLIMLCDAIIEAVKAAGPVGAPGGVLYSALMSAGCNLAQFESIMSALVSAGKLRREGHLYFVV